jgi:hypothetical protein
MERGAMQRGVGLFVIFGALAVGFVGARTKEYNADIATMKRVLQSVAMAEAAYHLDSATYTTNLLTQSWSASGTKVTLVSASDTSWSATVTHPGVRRSCNIVFVVRRGATLQEIIAARTAAIDGVTCG